MAHPSWRPPSSPPPFSHTSRAHRYNEVFQRKSGAGAPPLGTVAELLAPYGTAHYLVPNVNHPESVALMAAHDTDLLVLANTRVVKPAVLAVPRCTSMNAHAAYLPTHDPRHASPSPGGYIRGALVFMFALARNEPCAVTLHHVAEALDAGDIVDSMAVPVARGDDLEDVVAKVVTVTADLWQRGVVEWDGSTEGIKQDASLMLDATCMRGPQGDAQIELFDAANAHLKNQTYKWFAA